MMYVNHEHDIDAVMKERRLRSARRRRSQVEEEQISETATREESLPSNLPATPVAL